MRKLSILLMLLVAVSFAGNSTADIALDDFSFSSTGYVAPIPLSKAVLFDQSYDGTIVNGRDYSGYWHMADDFSVTNPSRLENIEWWSLFEGSVSTFDLRVHDDDGGLPDTILWQQLNVTATVTDTGDDFSSYDIYHIEVVLDPADYFLLSDGTTYWLSLHHDGAAAYWCRWDGGTAAGSPDYGNTWYSSGVTFMFRLGGTEDGSAVEETTWGQIKADL